MGNPEQFDPAKVEKRDETGKPTEYKYKKVADIPPEKKSEFEDVAGGGFVRKEAAALFDKSKEEAERTNRIRQELAEEDAKKANDKRSLWDKLRGANKVEPSPKKESDLYGVEWRADEDDDKEYQRKLGEKAQARLAAEAAERETKARAEKEKLVRETPGKFIQNVADVLKSSDPDDREGAIYIAKRQLGNLLKAFEIEDDADHHGIDALLHKIDPREQPELYGALVRSFMFFDKPRDKNFQGDWQHSVCHRFESYGKERDKEGGGLQSSVFDLTDTGPVRDVLEDFTRRATRDKGMSGNFTRILKPLLAYNINVVDAARLDDAFPLRPDSFSTEEFASAMPPYNKDWPDEEVRAFCKAKTPREFFVAAINQGISLVPKDYRKQADPGAMSENNRTHLAKILEAVKSDVATDVFEAYIKKNFVLQDQEIGIEQVIANTELAEKAVELVKGLFVDVDGTLIVDNGLNAELLEAMEAVSATGDPVIIFSGGDPLRATEKLKTLGVPEKFLPVRSKAEFKSKILGFLVDDTPANIQGFGAKTTVSPIYVGEVAEAYNNAREKWNQ